MEKGGCPLSNESMNYKTKHTHPCCNPGITDGAAYPVACGAPAKPGQHHNPPDDVEHRRQQGEDHLQLHEGERQFHLRATMLNILTFHL